MNRIGLRSFGLLACCMLLGCGSSPPTRFYILNDIAPKAQPPQLTNPMVVRVGPVAIPPELDRSELVFRSGANSVHVAGSQRWAAPLADQVRRVLSDDLAARLPPGLVADPNETATTEGRRLLSITIEEFYGDDNCAVSLRAHWTLTRPHAASLQGTERVQVPPSGACSAALPAAMSSALAALTDQLARAIAND